MQPAQAGHTPAPSRARPDTGEDGEVMALPGQAQQEFLNPVSRVSRCPGSHPKGP